MLNNSQTIFVFRILIVLINNNKNISVVMCLMTQCGMNDKSANRLQSHKSHKHKQFPVFFDLDNNGSFSSLIFVHLCFFSSCLSFTHLRCEKVKEIEIGGI